MDFFWQMMTWPGGLQSAHFSHVPCQSFGVSLTSGSREEIRPFESDQFGCTMHPMNGNLLHQSVIHEWIHPGKLTWKPNDSM